MGACFNSMEVDGKASQQEVIDQFNSRCEQDGWECGHSYSGSFSQFNGLRFAGKTFTSEQEATDYVEEHGEKWGPAVAVKYIVTERTKRMEAHLKAIHAMRVKVDDAQRKLWNAKEKMRVNNRLTKPSYVVKAEANFQKVKDLVEPKISEREKSIAEIVEKLAAKSKKSKWLLGGWASS